MSLYLVDDSGIGCLFGGVTVAVFRKTGKHFDYYADTIPVEYFQESKFKKRFYFTKAAQIIQKGFIKFLGKDWVSRMNGSHVILCRSPLFKEIEMFFIKNKISYKKEKIEGKPQEIIEGVNGRHLKKLGIPVKNENKGHGGLSFRDCVRLARKESRFRGKAKTGWGQFSKWV